MKLVKKVRLVFQEGKSDKVYEVDLVELPGSDAARFLVNFRFGRRGRTLQEGTKTVNPLPLDEAEATYRSVVVAKTNSGYHDEAGPAPARAPAVRPTAAATASIQEARTAALLKALAAQSDSKQRARIIWNLGQSDPGRAVSAVSGCVNRGDWIEDYSIAWTLGRWRDSATLSTLEKLRRHGNANVREIALESLLLTMPPASAVSELQSDQAELPPPLRAALDSGHEADLVRELQALAVQGSPATNRALIVCYRHALFAAPVQRALLTFFATCALAPGVFRAVRHVFKTAELRIDYDMFACLAHRFDTTPAFFRKNWDHAYIPGQGSMVVSKELARENSRLAFSNRTRLYLRRRAWRAMQRLGRADSAHYVALATAALLQVTDAHAVKPRTREVYRWNADARRRQKALTREYDEFAPLLVFNHILRGANPAYRLSFSGAAWSHSGAGAAVRGERYAHLWDRAPAAALDLLKKSRCSVVHDAAIRMLAGQTEFLGALSAGEIAQLLLSPYTQTTQFALPLAQALFNRGAGDDHLLLALLRSPLQQAREFGAQLLAAQPNWVANRSLLIELLLSFAAPIPGIVDAALATATLSEGDQQEVVSGVISQLLVRNIGITTQAAESLAQLLIRRLGPAVAALPITLIDRLLSHEDVGKQLLGARLLVANHIKFTEIPDRLMQHIQGSAHEEVRAIAIALLAKQTPADLLLQAEMLAELYYRGTAVERRELLTLFGALAASAAENQARVLRVLSALLFRAENELGQADELCAFFAAHAQGAAQSFDKDTVWRLLQAQATAAQRVGAVLLRNRPAAEFSVRQWARLAQHADASTRKYAMAAFESHEAAIKQHTRDALRILDSTWDDAREFGFRYFRERFSEADWAPEYIVGICDSTQDDVQAFGREILQRSFQQQQGPQYLATLSEHPSLNVQLFVSGFLENHAAGHRDRILGLRDYFVAVLSRVNAGRTAKDRTLQFLLREALRDGAVATMVAEVFTRVSLTVVRKDRGELIKALIALHSAYPHLVLPIKTLPVRARAAQKTAAGVSGGI